MLKCFYNHRDGNFAITAAIVFPLFMAVIGLVVDYMMFFDQRSRLQEAADAAALAAVKELSLAGTTKAKTTQFQEIASSYVASSYYDNAKAAAGSTDLDVIATPNSEKAEITVDITYRWTPMFAQLLDRDVTPIKVTATAQLAGDSLTCVVGLMQPQSFAKSSIHLDNRSVLKADGCSVYSNSTSKYGLRADGEAKMSAQSICTAGGTIEFGAAEFIPEPIIDCPRIDDPLANRAKPAFGGCNYDGLVITSDTELEPGVYCNGLTISENATAKLRTGVYVIKDGPLIVTDSASLIAPEASFFLTGDGSTFDFGADTTIDLSAMETGSMAGLLFYEDRNVNYSFDFNPFFMSKLPSDVRIHKISSNNARNLLGTIYLSRSIFLIDADAPVADASAYTAIITGRLWLQEGPILTLNADYTDTKVPVPDGIMGTEPILVH